MSTRTRLTRSALKGFVARPLFPNKEIINHYLTIEKEELEAQATITEICKNDETFNDYNFFVEFVYHDHSTIQNKLVQIPLKKGT